jgi:hypothetical protein
MLCSLALALLLAAGPARASAWPELLDQLAQARSRAELCAGFVKARVTGDGLHEAASAYGLAKSKMDGVIAGLQAVLTEGGRPDRLPQWQADLADARAGLQTVCDAAAAKSHPGTLGVYDELLKASVEPLIKAIADGVAGLFHWAVESDERIRKSRETQLEAAIWPAFEKIDAR